MKNTTPTQSNMKEIEYLCQEILWEIDDHTHEDLDTLRVWDECLATIVHGEMVQQF